MEIKKILIANRGEIALRIIRTCKEIGIKTVALCPVKGQEDDFPETKFADEFYFLDKEGVQGYLDQARIIEIAKKAKVDAIHPGYGFLSENADFSELCQKSGVKFIGASPTMLRQLGDKIEAKKIAKKCGVPILASSLKTVESEAECKAMVEQIGIPVLLKAVDGGGGIGIEIIDKNNKKELLTIFNKLQRVAQNAFGSGRIFVEKCLIKPRHIEFQVIGDGRGNAVHLFERECSIQRRHQKLIEEAPSPFLDWRMRDRMGKAACKIISHLKYEGLATVEFLVDDKKNYYFGEVNPRLQVEHPVTEMITGFDLVAEQIRMASGDKLNLKQRHIRMNGWAMEFRITAEDPFNNFVPQSGRVGNYQTPGGDGVEIHSFCKRGQKIFPFFDSLISKMVVYHKDRKMVLARSRRAFDEYIMDGITTNIPFHRAVLENESFNKGIFSTHFIEDEKILEGLKKEKIKKPAKHRPKEDALEQEELAYILANIYHDIKGHAQQGSGPSKWKMASRMHK